MVDVQCLWEDEDDFMIYSSAGSTVQKSDSSNVLEEHTKKLLRSSAMLPRVLFLESDISPEFPEPGTHTW